jgi:Resolvase, N terminal domain
VPCSPDLESRPWRCAEKQLRNRPGLALNRCGPEGGSSVPLRLRLLTLLTNQHQELYKTKNMRIALHARVSTKDKGQDTEDQLRQLRHYAKQQNWTICGEYVDQKTERTADRAEFQRFFRTAARI